jgi:hypothetical protein
MVRATVPVQCATCHELKDEQGFALASVVLELKA